MEYIDHQVAEGIKAVKYIVGDLTVDGHTHVFYLRDDLPRASSTESDGDLFGYHAHSIEEGPNNTLQCTVAGRTPHFHTLFTKEGD